MALVLACTLIYSAGCGEGNGGDEPSAAGSASGGAGMGSGGSSKGGTSGAGDSAGTSPSGGANAGSSGSTGNGGSSDQTGGASNAGGSESIGGSSSGSGAHCTPGDVLTWPEEVYDTFGGPLTACETTPEGIPEPIRLSTGIALPEPLAPGAAYAFSVVISNAPADGSATIEFWGSTTSCGFGAELLYTGTMTIGTLCVELNPTATYEHLIMIWRAEDSLGHRDVAICPGGSCE